MAKASRVQIRIEKALRRIEAQLGHLMDREAPDFDPDASIPDALVEELQEKIVLLEQDNNVLTERVSFLEGLERTISDSENEDEEEE